MDDLLQYINTAQEAAQILQSVKPEAEINAYAAPEQLQTNPVELILFYCSKDNLSLPLPHQRLHSINNFKELVLENSLSPQQFAQLTQLFIKIFFQIEFECQKLLSENFGLIFNAILDRIATNSANSDHNIAIFSQLSDFFHRILENFSENEALAAAEAPISPIDSGINNNQVLLQLNLANCSLLIKLLVKLSAQNSLEIILNRAYKLADFASSPNNRYCGCFLLCSLLLEIPSFSQNHTILGKLQQILLAMCQDTYFLVRRVMSEQIEPLIALFNNKNCMNYADSLLAELAELTKDEEFAVQRAALASLFDLLASANRKQQNSSLQPILRNVLAAPQPKLLLFLAEHWGKYTQNVINSGKLEKSSAPASSNSSQNTKMLFSFYKSLYNHSDSAIRAACCHNFPAFLLFNAEIMANSPNPTEINAINYILAQFVADSEPKTRGIVAKFLPQYGKIMEKLINQGNCQNLLRVAINFVISLLKDNDLEIKATVIRNLPAILPFFTAAHASEFNFPHYYPEINAALLQFAELSKFSWRRQAILLDSLLNMNKINHYCVLSVEFSEKILGILLISMASGAVELRNQALELYISVILLFSTVLRDYSRKNEWIYRFIQHFAHSKLSQHRLFFLETLRVWLNYLSINQAKRQFLAQIENLAQDLQPSVRVAYLELNCIIKSDFLRYPSDNQRIILLEKNLALLRADSNPKIRSKLAQIEAELREISIKPDNFPENSTQLALQRAEEPELRAEMERKAKDEQREKIIAQKKKEMALIMKKKIRSEKPNEQEEKKGGIAGATAKSLPGSPSHQPGSGGSKTGGVSGGGAGSTMTKVTPSPKVAPMRKLVTDGEQKSISNLSAAEKVVQLTKPSAANTRSLSNDISSTSVNHNSPGSSNNRSSSMSVPPSGISNSNSRGSPLLHPQAAISRNLSDSSSASPSLYSSNNVTLPRLPSAMVSNSVSASESKSKENNKETAAKLKKKLVSSTSHTAESSNNVSNTNNTGQSKSPPLQSLSMKNKSIVAGSKANNNASSKLFGGALLNSELGFLSAGTMNLNGRASSRTSPTSLLQLLSVI